MPYALIAAAWMALLPTPEYPDGASLSATAIPEHRRVSFSCDRRYGINFHVISGLLDFRMGPRRLVEIGPDKEEWWFTAPSGVEGAYLEDEWAVKFADRIGEENPLILNIGSGPRVIPMDGYNQGLVAVLQACGEIIRKVRAVQ